MSIVLGGLTLSTLNSYSFILLYNYFGSFVLRYFSEKRNLVLKRIDNLRTERELR